MANTLHINLLNLDRCLHTTLSRLSDENQEKLVSLAFAIEEKGQHNLGTDMEIEELTKLYGFATTAESKMNFVAKFRYNGMMKFMRDTQTVSCHPILKKYLLIGRAVENLREEFKDKVKKIIRESLRQGFADVENHKLKDGRDEPIITHPTDGADKCCCRDQVVFTKPTNENMSEVRDIVTQPVEETEKDGPDDVRFFPTQINKPETCFPAYPKCADTSIENKAIVTQPAEEDDKSGFTDVRFFPKETDKPANCLRACPKGPNSDERKHDKNNVEKKDYVPEESTVVADVTTPSHQNRHSRSNIGNSDIRQNLKDEYKPKYFHSKSLSDSEITANEKNPNNLQNDLSKSENRVNIHFDIESMEENDQYPSTMKNVSDHIGNQGYQRVATVYPYRKTSVTKIETEHSKGKGHDIHGAAEGETSEETQVKTLSNYQPGETKHCNSDQQRKRNTFEINSKEPSGDSVHNWGSGLDPNSLFSDSSASKENQNPTKKPDYPQEPQEQSASNSSHLAATTKGVLTWIFKPFLKSPKTNGDVQNI